MKMGIWLGLLFALLCAEGASAQRLQWTGRDGYRTDGLYCREGTMDVTIDQRPQTGYVVACQERNGAWRIDPNATASSATVGRSTSRQTRLPAVQQNQQVAGNGPITCQDRWNWNQTTRIDPERTVRSLGLGHGRQNQIGFGEIVTAGAALLPKSTYTKGGNCNTRYVTSQPPF